MTAHKVYNFAAEFENITKYDRTKKHTVSAS